MPASKDACNLFPPDCSAIVSGTPEVGRLNRSDLGRRRMDPDDDPDEESPNSDILSAEASFSSVAPCR